MLTVVSSPSDGGIVAVSPVATKYGATAAITITAAPSAGYVFEKWTGETGGIADPTQNQVTFINGR